MNAIEKIKERLSAYADVRYTAGPGRITVHPRDGNGFTVGLRITTTALTVNFDGWHEEFETEEEARGVPPESPVDTSAPPWWISLPHRALSLVPSNCGNNNTWRSGG
jgi:hypothetical protein